MDSRTCIEESVQAVTYGRSYEVFGSNPRNPHQIRIKNDRGDKVWIAASCFADGEISVPMIQDFTIDAELAESQAGAIEVTLVLMSGERRWCVFATPAALVQRGDTLDDQTTRIHYDVPHLIIVSAIDASIIAQSLDHIQRHGALLRCTRAVEAQKEDNETSGEHKSMEPQ
jgi:hypothetical protein